MYYKGDFHLHTNESDGTLSPKELVALAKKNQIDIMAITDHDSTNGVAEALESAKSVAITIIPAIELSTRHNNESIHILGYFRDDSYANSSLQDALKEITDYRIKRAIKIVENLKIYFDIELDYKKVLQNAEGVVARPHIAKAIIDAGYPYSIDYIFKHIISTDSPAYLPNKQLTIEDGIALLKSANALVVLAHPILIKKSSIEDLMKFDFDGIEAIYPLNSAADTENLIKIGEKHNKIITAGSDFHTNAILDTKHGKIGETFLDRSKIEIFLSHLSQK